MKLTKLKSIGIALFVCLMAFSVNAQQAIGVRGLYEVGASVTFKNFFKHNTAFEIIGNYYKNRDLDIIALYEKHNNFNSAGFSYYYGVGAKTDIKVVSLSAVAVVGLDYTFRKIPLNMSLDWMPTVYTFRSSEYWFNGGGLAIRYIF